MHQIVKYFDLTNFVSLSHGLNGYLLYFNDIGI